MLFQHHKAWHVGREEYTLKPDKTMPAVQELARQGKKLKSQVFTYFYCPACKDEGQDPWHYAWYGITQDGKETPSFSIKPQDAQSWLDRMESEPCVDKVKLKILLRMRVYASTFTMTIRKDPANPKIRRYVLCHG